MPSWRQHSTQFQHFVHLLGDMLAGSFGPQSNVGFNRRMGETSFDHKIAFELYLFFFNM
jgi:hypothetical protein